MVIYRTLDRNHECGQWVLPNIKNIVEKFNVESIKFVNRKISGNSRLCIHNYFGVHEEMWYFKLRLYLVISKNKYIMERLLGIDIIELIREDNDKNMKITIKWVE